MIKALAIIAAVVISITYFSVLATEVDLGVIEIKESEVIVLSVDSVPYGGVTGTVKMKLGEFEWYPDSVWILPVDEDINDFNYSGSSYRVPAEVNLTNNCISSIYNYNDKKAYKAGVKDGGKFCLLADPGTYRLVAEY